MQQTNNNNTMMAGKNDESEMTTLLLAFQSGDVNAFSRLYDLNINILFNYGCKLTTDRELLKDCIHDVFVKIYTKQAELNHIENFKSYLFISLKNRLCDEIRKRVYVSDAEVEELNPVSHDDVENNYLVKRLLNQLSPRQREALTLYYIEERKYEDICEIMNMNYQSVRNLMHRGLSKLKSIAG